MNRKREEKEENNKRKIRLTYDEHHVSVDKNIYDQKGIFYKSYPWHYEKESRLILSCKEMKIGRFPDCNVARIQIPNSCLERRLLKNRIIRSPMYEGTDYGLDSKLKGEVEWTL